MKRAFTLIELLMVIAIIAIISTLAVNKVGGVRYAAALRVSVANMKSVERGVSSFLAMGGKLNRLDGLFDAQASGVEQGSGNGFEYDMTTYSPTSVGLLYKGIVDCGSLDRKTASERNSGLMDSLTDNLVPYSLSAKEAAALKDLLGLEYVMEHNTFAEGYPSQHYGYKCDDGSIANASDGLDANASACIARAVTNLMLVAAVSPVTDLGRTIYQACGQDVLNNQWGTSYDRDEATATVNATGGPLIAFGLGDSASVVGNSNAGLDSAPYATFPQKKYYTRYILLFRLRKVGSGSVTMIVPEFAGVLDCCGNTHRAAEHILKSL